MSKRMISYRFTLINSIGTFISRITGLARQQIINYFFGAGADSFFAAFQIPNTVRRYVGEGALANAFIPVFQKVLSEDDQEKASLFASNVMNIFLLITITVSILASLLAPFYFPLLIPGHKQGIINLREGINLVIIMMPFVIFISLFALGMGILNSYKRFLTPSFAPILWNVAIILTPLLFLKQLGIYSIGLGVSIGGLLMFLTELIELKHVGFKYRFYINLRDPHLRDFIKLFIPTSINMIALTSKDLVSSVFKSLFQGAFTTLLNALIIIEAPLGIISTAIGTVLMPLMVRFKIDKDTAGFEKSLQESFSMLVYLIIPISFYFVVYPDTIVNCLFRDISRLFTGSSGKVTADFLQNNYHAASLYSVAIIPMAFISIFERIFYSVKDVKTPLKANIITIFICFGLYFLSLIPSIGLQGIIIAEISASWIVFFYYLLFQLKKIVEIRKIVLSISRNTVIIIILSVISILAVYPFHTYIYKTSEKAYLSLLTGASEFLLFAGAYFLSTKLFKVELKR